MRTRARSPNLRRPGFPPRSRVAFFERLTLAAPTGSFTCKRRGFTCAGRHCSRRAPPPPLCIGRFRVSAPSARPRLGCTHPPAVWLTRNARRDSKCATTEREALGIKPRQIINRFLAGRSGTTDNDGAMKVRGNTMSLANEANIARALALAPAEAGIAAVKRENEQLRSITGELGHRIKNLVAVIQSIARQTMHRDHDQGRFRGALLGPPWRVWSLPRSSHRQRLARSASRRTLRSELTTFGDLDGAQISVNGPALDLNAGSGTQHQPCVTRAGDQRLQVWSALGARGQSCRALGDRQTAPATALPHDLARVRRSDGD